MNGKFIFKILGGLGELNYTQTSSNTKVLLMKIGSLNYGVIIFSVGACRISFLKLSFSEVDFANFQDKLYSEILSNVKDLCRTYLLHVFCLPFTLLDIIHTNQNIWVIGSKTVVDIKPYLESALNEDKKDDYMDTDDIEDFHQNMFETVINVHQFDSFNFQINDIIIGCDHIDYGVIKCHANSQKSIWQLELVLLKARTKLSNVVCILDVPMFSCESKMPIVFNQDGTRKNDPVLIFIHRNDPESQILQNIFDLNCSPSNFICLVGHPDGSLMWTYCDLSVKCNSLELQTLHNMKQPITGIHFVEGTDKFKDCKFLLVIGALGQTTLFSDKQIPSFTAVVAGKQHHWILTTHLQSSIKSSTMLENYLLHISYDGKFWITDISVLLNASTKESIIASQPSDLCCVDQVIIVDKGKGLVLLKTLPGNLYLAICEKEIEPSHSVSSLPFLMNECLQQSSLMQKLLHIKVMQSRLYKALSTFSSLKFTDNMNKEYVAFSITEINLEPKRYILIINLEFLEKLHLDSELCHISASVFTYFENDFTLASKTLPYNSDQPTLCLELTDTILQPPFISIFPLHVEIGLILQLPDQWVKIDCFKAISNCLPFYLSVKSFMIHELHLFHNNAMCQPQLTKHKNSRDSLEAVKRIGMQRPITSLMPVKNKNIFSFPTKFNLCLSLSSVEELMKGSGDVDSCKYIQHLLFGDRFSVETTQETSGNSKDCDLSVTVKKNHNILVISVIATSFEMLVGLRIAVIDILLTAQNQHKSFSHSSAYVNIPASMYRRCEEISKCLVDLFGKDVDSDEVTAAIIQLYQELRSDVSGKLPIL